MILYTSFVFSGASGGVGSCGAAPVDFDDSSACSAKRVGGSRSVAGGGVAAGAEVGSETSDEGVGSSGDTLGSGRSTPEPPIIQHQNYPPPHHMHQPQQQQPQPRRQQQQPHSHQSQQQQVLSLTNSLLLFLFAAKGGLFITASVWKFFIFFASSLCKPWIEQHRP